MLPEMNPVLGGQIELSFLSDIKELIPVINMVDNSIDP